MRSDSPGGLPIVQIFVISTAVIILFIENGPDLAKALTLPLRQP
jgi:hypothetical protein